MGLIILLGATLKIMNIRLDRKLEKLRQAQQQQEEHDRFAPDRSDHKVETR